jgi:hypothetical protein
MRENTHKHKMGEECMTNEFENVTIVVQQNKTGMTDTYILAFDTVCDI